MQKKLIYNYLSDDELLRISNKIKDAEKTTAGEICVSIKEKKSLIQSSSIYELAKKEFYKLNVNKTRDKTGILIFILLDKKQFYILASFVYKDPFWKAQIMQVYINNEGDMELIPRVGNHTIILGDVSGLEDKFSKLMIFYKQGLSKTGWNEYSTINLKYNNQVICTKK